MEQKYSAVLFATIFLTVEAGRILAVYPTPSFSHQVVFRPLMLELAKREHQVTVITTHPIFQKGQAPENYIEIDVQKTSKAWVRNISGPIPSVANDYNDAKNRVILCTNAFYEQLQTDEVREIINDRTIEFDLIIIESWLRAALAFAHRFKVPVIKFGSLGGVTNEHDIIGGLVHPVIYFSTFAKKIEDLTFWDQISELYNYWSLFNMYEGLKNNENKNLRSYFGSDMPSLTVLNDKISAIMLNIHRVWEMYRPSPLNLITVGGIHIQPGEELPKDLKSYLDSSIHGVIYVSFGSRYDTSVLPSKQVEAMVHVFSRLPYDVLWKCNKGELPGRSKNIRIFKWLPQQELLKHPNIKLFVTQGGLQSIDEAIAGGVPLLGIPLATDQYYNAENIVRLNIGMKLPIRTFTEQDFEDKVYKLIKDNRYSDNVVQLRSLLYDTPQSPLQRAIWWTEHVLRHGALHVRAPAHNMHWTEYFEIELLAIVVISVSLFAILSVIIIFNTTNLIWRVCSNFSRRYFSQRTQTII